MSPVTNPQIIGLLYDAVGILILGVPAVFRMSQEVQAQSGTYYNYNVHLAKALATSRVDISIGSVVLLIGFVSQLFGNLGYVYIPSYGWCLGIGAVGFLLVYFIFLRGRFADALLKHVKAALEQEAKR